MYLDASVDRLASRAQLDFDTMVEATRAGSVFSSNRKAYDAWLRRRKAKASRGMVGVDLERAIGAIAMTHPEYVVVGA